MNGGRSYRVQTRQNVARKYRQRKRLVAGTVIVTAGHLVPLVERMIQLKDEAVDVVACRSSDEQIGARIEQRDRAVRPRPGISRKQFRDHRILWTAKRGYFARVGHASHRVQADAFPLAFPTRKPERLVFDAG